MQMKHVIIASIVAIVMLAGFNIISGMRHDSQRSAMLSRTESPASLDSQTAQEPTSLGNQPKAILNDAQSKIDAAQLQNEKQLATAEQEPVK